MAGISPIDFMKFCIDQGFEFVLIDEENKVINKDNVEELDKIMDKKGLIPMDMRKINNHQNNKDS